MSNNQKPKLILDLGRIKVKNYITRFGIFECPICKNGYKSRTYEIKSGQSTKCRICANELRKVDARVTDHPLWTHFNNMKQRCNNVNHFHYKTYGGRGILIKWKTFTSFVEDMYDKYKTALENGIVNISIDRIDNDGNYEASNCQWISVEENSSRRHKGVPKSEAHKLAMSLERKGKPQTKARIMAVEASSKKRKKKVVQKDINGNVIYVFGSSGDAQIKTGICASNINRCCNNGKYRKTAGGYKWEFLDESV